PVSGQSLSRRPPTRYNKVRVFPFLSGWARSIPGFVRTSARPRGLRLSGLGEGRGPQPCRLGENAGRGEGRGSRFKQVPEYTRRSPPALLLLGVSAGVRPSDRTAPAATRVSSRSSCAKRTANLRTEPRGKLARACNFLLSMV